ncbi:MULTISPECIES: hypothetical protein [Desulfosediminicola]|uniref:hypothetical protein n=1 Tax=Desulfosediminicola TaxID=2886823 RepID=UPI0010AB8663|nr:hypothetical protein [Desulfosediminicola ganghwensis]
MSQESELRRLESFVSKLLVSYQELKLENDKLTLELQEQYESVAQMKDRLAVHENERSEISTRVNGLIEQIEEWEINLGEEVFDTLTLDDHTEQRNLFNSSETETAVDGAQADQQESGRTS